MLSQRDKTGELTEMEESSYVKQVIKNRGRDVKEGELTELLAALMVASVDTTSSLINWILINLARNPAVQEKLHAELSDKLKGESIASLRDKSLREELPYLHAVIRESHRLTPSVFVASVKKVGSEIDVAGYRLPEGTVVALNLNAMQNDPSIVPDVSEFKPERWASEQVSGRKGTDGEVIDHQIVSNPFSVGSRKCPGARVAHNEVVCFVAQLVQDWKFEPHPEDPSWQTHIDDVPYHQGVVSQPSPMPKFKISPRV
mmetsp:Transcript_44876/g.70300  ORF Transcript_44876/g.70300 Transcript_44876/m.70300 type:complete len:258 (-) Transcript_44876:450-1223(-)